MSYCARCAELERRVREWKLRAAGPGSGAFDGRVKAGSGPGARSAYTHGYKSAWRAVAYENIYSRSDCRHTPAVARRPEDEMAEAGMLAQIGDSQVIHGVSLGSFRTLCGRDAYGHIVGSGTEEEITCGNCERAMQPVRDMAKLNRRGP